MQPNAGMWWRRQGRRGEQWRTAPRTSAADAVAARVRSTWSKERRSRGLAPQDPVGRHCITAARSPRRRESIIVAAASTPSPTPPSGDRATHGGRADLWLTAVVPAGTHVRLSV